MALSNLHRLWNEKLLSSIVKDFSANNQYSKFSVKRHRSRHFVDRNFSPSRAQLLTLLENSSHASIFAFVLCCCDRWCSSPCQTLGRVWTCSAAGAVFASSSSCRSDALDCESKASSRVIHKSSSYWRASTKASGRTLILNRHPTLHHFSLPRDLKTNRN